MQNELIRYAQIKISLSHNFHTEASFESIAECTDDNLCTAALDTTYNKTWVDVLIIWYGTLIVNSWTGWRIFVTQYLDAIETNLSSATYSLSHTKFREFFNRFWQLSCYRYVPGNILKRHICWQTVTLEESHSLKASNSAWIFSNGIPPPLSFHEEKNKGAKLSCFLVHTWWTCTVAESKRLAVRAFYQDFPLPLPLTLPLTLSLSLSSFHFLVDVAVLSEVRKLTVKISD